MLMFAERSFAAFHAQTDERGHPEVIQIHLESSLGAFLAFDGFSALVILSVLKFLHIFLPVVSKS